MAETKEVFGNDGAFRQAWFLTENNFADDSPLLLIEDTLKGAFRYIKLSSEIGTSGTPHLHAYIVLSRSQRFSYLKRRFPRADIEARKGSHVECQAYVGKGDKDGQVLWVKEYGSDEGIGVQGFRADLSVRTSICWEIKERIDSGASLKSIYDEYFPYMMSWGRELRSYYERFSSCRVEVDHDKNQL